MTLPSMEVTLVLSIHDAVRVRNLLHRVAEDIRRMLAEHKVDEHVSSVREMMADYERIGRLVDDELRK